MRIYLVRHAEAEEGLDDAARPLSAGGRARFERVARFLRERGAMADLAEIWHSPLVRARQTAEILAAGLGGGVVLSQVGGLEPGHNPGVIAARLDRAERPVAVVGHEPHLSSLGALLVTGRVRPLFLMHKGSVLALERAGSGSHCSWFADWQLAPELAS